MKLTPLAAILTSASVGPGTGTGTSTTCNASGPPGSLTTIFFMRESLDELEGMVWVQGSGFRGGSWFGWFRVQVQARVQDGFGFPNRRVHIHMQLQITCTSS